MKASSIYWKTYSAFLFSEMSISNISVLSSWRGQLSRRYCWTPPLWLLLLCQLDTFHLPRTRPKRTEPSSSTKCTILHAIPTYLSSLILMAGCRIIGRYSSCLPWLWWWFRYSKCWLCRRYFGIPLMVYLVQRQQQLDPTPYPAVNL